MVERLIVVKARWEIQYYIQWICQGASGNRDNLIPTAT